MPAEKAVARRLRHPCRAPPHQAWPRIQRRCVRQRIRHMDFGRISRRHLLQGSAALTLGSALGVRTAAAADTTIGFIYVGSRDDYGYNQAHAQGAAALKKI